MPLLVRTAFGVSPYVVKGLRAKLQYAHRYAKEDEKLKRLIAEYHGVGQDNIILTDGCDGALGLVCRTFLSKNDTVGIPVPTFHRYEYHATLAGADITDIPTQQDGFFLRQAPSGFKLAFLCNPNNPTGRIIPKKAIRDVLAGNDLVALDETLGQYNNIDNSKLIEKEPNLIVCRSFSKLFGLAGMRIGYAMADEEVISAIKAVTSPHQLNYLAQEAAKAAIVDRGHQETCIRHNRKETEFIKKKLKGTCYRQFRPSNITMFIDCNKVGDSTAIHKRLLKDGINTTDGKAYKGIKGNYLRITVLKRRENRQVIAALREASNV